MNMSRQHVIRVVWREMEEFPQDKQQERQEKEPSLKKIALLASIGTGMQFGYALQFSLLTPYVQLLGIPHKWTSFIWLCGPISGLIVQPIMGYLSDKCQSRWGRRRPFIAGGCFLVLVAIFLISFAADFGRLFGDPLGSTRVKPKAIVIFVTGFWILDVGNNTLQGPCRAFLADLAGKNEQRTRNVFALYSFFLSLGNVLGFTAESFSHVYKLLPFTKSVACDLDCANLKTCFFISAFLLFSLTTIALIFVRDNPLVEPVSGSTDEDEEMVGFTSHPAKELAGTNSNDPSIEKNEKKKVEPKKIVKVKSMEQIMKALRDLPRSMWILVLVMCLNWMAWCPFLLYDTDWMGREVYGGKVGEGRRYGSGVRAGSLGLLLNSIVVGCISLRLEFLTQKAGGEKRLWGCVNFLLALCLGFTVLIAKLAESSRSSTHISPPLGIRLSALALFALLGLPLAVTYSIPFAIASNFSNSSGAGQGLTVGVLNLGIVIPMILVSMTSGPWDALFGGGNLPSFVVGAFFAMASGIVILTMLPSSELPTRSRITRTKKGSPFS